MTGLKEVWRRWRPGAQAPSPLVRRERAARCSKPPDETCELAIGLYRQLAGEPGNLCFSPFSVAVALGMTLAGARGPTADELRSVMHLPPSGERLLGETIARLRAGPSGNDGVTLANGMWRRQGAPVLAAYRDLLAGTYRAKEEAADFVRSPGAARAAINAWVGKQTGGGIRELLDRRAITPDSRLVLVSALCFRGRWDTPFPDDETRERDFHVGPGVVARVPMMAQLECLRHASGEGFQAVELDYHRPAASMLILLPDERDGWRGLEGKLSAGFLRDCVAALTARLVELRLPRFRLRRGTTDLARALRAMGVERAFDPERADFSGINGRVPPDPEALHVSSVEHQALVDVNEEGTEAAAATAVDMGVMAVGDPSPPPPPRFHADHPFLFAIRERESGTILFLGRVNDPRERT